MASSSKQAAEALKGDYTRSRTGIDKQSAQTAQLYNALVAGLVPQQAASTQGILASAQRRGVARPALAADLTAALDPAYAQAAAQLGVGQAEAGSQFAQTRGQLGVGRATAQETLAGTLQQGDLARQEHRLAMDTLQQEAEIQRQAAAVARSRSGGGGGGLDSGTEDAIQATLNQLRGSDGNVSPQSYKEGMVAWVESGGSEAEYHNKFRDLVNLQHPQDYYDIGSTAPPTLDTLRKAVPRVFLPRNLR